MTEADRAEQAFRDAFERRATDAPTDPVDVRRPRRTWWIASAAAAAVVVAAVAVPTALLGGEDVPPSGPPPATVTGGPATDGWRTVAYLDVELEVPEGWPSGFGPARPDCVQKPGDDWSGDVPSEPNVEFEAPGRAIPLIGCTSHRPPDAPRVFGDLIFEMWQPKVELREADLSGSPDGTWEYLGWMLTRRTVGHVQIGVLTSPETPAGTAEHVLGSARTVSMTADGCETTSPVQAEEFTTPVGALPDSASDGMRVVECHYRTTGTDEPGLIGSRVMDGREAEQLVEAILAAPTGGGPDQPQHCMAGENGDYAIALRFLPEDWSRRHVAYPEAYVYYDHCFGNGIFGKGRSHQLTADNCRPLFAEPPIVFWSGSSHIAEICVRQQ